MRLHLSTAAAAAAMAASAALVQPASAQVVITIRDVTTGIQLSCDSSTPVTISRCPPGFLVGSVNNVSFNGMVGLIKIRGLSATANSPGTARQAVRSLQYAVTNPGATARQLYIDLTSFNFTAPTGAAIRSTGTTSVSPNNAVTANFTEKFFAAPATSAAC